MFNYPISYDVIVIGAGHSGVEAALASARIGCNTLLLSMNLDTIGQMSCNPAIGGLAKGHLVREIDALGGEMAKTTDLTGLQFRMLNTRKGPSVWAPRAQCDKKAYQFRMKWVCERQINLCVKQAQVTRIVHDGDKIVGVETDHAIRFDTQCLIVTTGTFLKGLLHVGDVRRQGGRLGDQSANSLSDSLHKIGIEISRLKTGTPPRLLRRTVDFSKCEIQHGDEPAPNFSFWNGELFHMEQESGVAKSDSRDRDFVACRSIIDQIGGQIPCYITRTTPRTRELILTNLHRSPMYSGAIDGVGPRYCPSIEDKIVRFKEKHTHQIFLEPEGILTDEIYVNGLSTSLPTDVQFDLVRSIVGCEEAEIMRPAYAVEYDFANPCQLHHSLESKLCRNLFLAGQINGTSGYEEAAAQGLIAGINAALRVLKKDPLVLRRDQAYIGVLIDDLVAKGAKEPYRIFTSQAEFRLLLRQDNADLRLSHIGYGVGLLPLRQYRHTEEKRSAVENEVRRLNSVRSGSITCAHLLKRPEVRYRDLPNKDDSLSKEVTTQVEIAIKYEGYVARQETESRRLIDHESKTIPESMDYGCMTGLSSEARQKLTRIRPKTIGQASRISGISPADVSLILVWLKRSAIPASQKSESCELALQTNA